MGITSGRPDGSPVGPSRFGASAVTVLALGGCAGAAVVAAALADAAGRILLAVVAAGFAVETLRLAVIRPTVAVDAAGVSVRTGLAARSWPWSQVGVVRARTSRRLVTTRTLELDLGDSLVVVPAYRLGRDPADAAAAIEALRPVSS